MIGVKHFCTLTDLKNLVNEVARLATRREQNEVSHKDFLDALAAALVARETLNEQEVLEVTGLAPAPPRSVLWLRELNMVIRIARG